MRRIAAIVFLFAATVAFGQRTRPVTPPTRVSGNTVSGIVSSVPGPFAILDGLVTLDLSDAKFSGDPLEPGAVVFAVLKSVEVAPNAPLPVSYVIVTRIPQTLTGPVTAVDLAHRTLTLLGRTFNVTSQSVFTTLLPSFRGIDLSDIVPGQLLMVDARVAGGALEVRSARLLALNSPAVPTLLHGAVQSIAADAWTINGVAVRIDAQTRIGGQISNGDIVDAVVDSNGVAVTIVLVAHQVRFSGVVAEITPTTWRLIVAGDAGGNFFFFVNANTKIIGDPKIGDRVDVFGEMPINGPIIATSITKVP